MPMNFDATVIATYGRRAAIRADDGTLSDVPLFGRRLSVVCGDRVACETDSRSFEVQLVAVRPRRTALYRSNLRGGSEPVVANLDQLLVAVAPRPQPDWFVVDRYLSAAASSGLEARLVLNKIDLASGVEADLERELASYAACGYALVRCSARSGLGMPELLGACDGKRSVLVGQSGTGKSSLLGHLAPGSGALTGDLVRDEEGRHTTTTARMYEVARGGELIDSPGVRDFAPALEHIEPRALGFVEVDALSAGCRFQDCRHIREPGCAVRAAVEAGTLAPRRYESYRRLRNLVAQLEEARGPKRRR